MERPVIYLDASAIMRLVDGDEPARQRITELIKSREVALLTSVLSTIECRSKPLREGNLERVERYNQFFKAGDMTVSPVDGAVAERATELRAKLNLKTPDSIHLATAAVRGAEMLVTTDRDFTRAAGVTSVEIQVVPMA